MTLLAQNMFPVKDSLEKLLTTSATHQSLITPDLSTSSKVRSTHEGLTTTEEEKTDDNDDVEEEEVIVRTCNIINKACTCCKMVDHTRHSLISFVR